VSVKNAGAVVVEILVDGTKVEPQFIRSFVIDRDLNQPCMASIVLTNTDHRYSKTKIGATVEVKVGSGGESIYKGEVVGLEPRYKANEPSVALIRCMNKMHRLLRKRQSKTYADMSDQDIISSIVGGHGLSLDWDGPTITHKLVYQHNQTDLEFVRHRASRLGLDVWCEDSKLFVKKPQLDQGEVATLNVANAVAGGGEQLRAFTPRLSSAPVVKKVTVRGWNPEKKELITHTANAASSSLGSDGAASSLSQFGDVETFTVDHPIWSKEEAKALAEARLHQLALGYITGEADAVGDPKFQLGKILKIVVNPSAADVFNGKYLITGVSFRQTTGSGPDSGFTATLRVARDASGGAGAGGAS
jgi:phage protein D